MLNLKPIKDRLAAATPDHWRWDLAITGLDANGDEEWLIISQNEHAPDAALVGTARTKEDADLITHAPADLAALVAEVERLRDAIKTHERTGRRMSNNPHDRDLWAVLDA